MSLAALLRGLVLDLLFLPLLVLLTPAILFLIVVRRRGFGSLGERLGGWRLSSPQRERIWVHCVSVGELQAVGPLLDALLGKRPGAEFVLSVTTTTARDVARVRYPDIPTFLYPVDLSLCVRRVLSRVRPSLIVLVELEVWPQLVLEATGRGVPVVVVNGRISDRGGRRLALLGPLARAVFSRLTEVHARDAECAERFRNLGAPPDRVFAIGNLKFDRAMVEDPARARRELDRRGGYEPAAPRWIAGCTHAGEEEIVLAAHASLRRTVTGLTLVVAPRHVERAEAVLALARERGFSVAAESALAGDAPEVVVVDRTGGLVELYAAADVAFVGGSLIDRGGHNILEPVLAGTPALHGPSMTNFREQVALLSAGDAAETVAAEGLEEAVARLLGDPALRAARVDAGRSAIAASRGAAERSAERLRALLAGRDGAATRPASVESTPSTR